MMTSVRATIGWDEDSVRDTIALMTNMMRSGCISLGFCTEAVENTWPQEGGGGSGQTVALANGTAALELVWNVLHVDIVIVPEMTVPMVKWAAAPSNTVHVVDVDDLLCMDLAEAELWANTYQSDGFKVGICYVATGGLVNPNLPTWIQSMKARGHRVVVDMSHAHGVTLNGYGIYTQADAAVWSFYATKVLTCGEGGIAWFQNKKDADTAKLVANQGKRRGSGKFETRGKNYRLSEFAAAVMQVEVSRARGIYETRRRVAAAYDNAGIPGLHQRVAGLSTSFYKYVLPVSATRFGRDGADALEKALLDLGVQCTGRVHGFNDNSGKAWSYPKSKFWARNHVCLPVGRLMTDAQIDTVVKAWDQVKV